jgi:hypothetical protein
MKAIIAGILLVTASATAWGQAGGLTNADVSKETSITDPAVALRSAQDEWIAFSIPVLKGTRSPCCWQGSWADDKAGFAEVGCALKKPHQSFGTQPDSPETENVIVLGEVHLGELSSLRVVGEHCPVEGDGASVLWIGGVDSSAGMNWLETVARSDERESVRHSALFALALHRSEEVNRRLHEMALTVDANFQQEAIFWLGETRGENGLGVLESLLKELPAGDTRQQINFALAQTGTEAAFDLLSKISRTDADPEQQGNALFWLANEFPEQSRDILLQALANEQDTELVEQAVFAISQLPHEMSSPLLLELARDNQQTDEVRRQALFWLANSDDDEALAALTDLLTR